MQDLRDQQEGIVAMGVGSFALALLLVAMGLAIYPSWPAIGTWSTRADAAAWVQALGSVGAIFAAIAIAAWQHQREQNRLRRERAIAAEKQRSVLATRVQLAITASSYVKHSSGKLSDRLKQMSTQEDLQAIVHTMASLRRYCEQVPIWTLENHTIAGRWSVILFAVVEAEAALIHDIPKAHGLLQQLVQTCRLFYRDFSNAQQEILAVASDMGWDIG